MKKEVKITLSPSDKSALKTTAGIFRELIEELQAENSDSCIVNANYTDYNGDEWDRSFLLDIEEVLESLSESDTLSPSGA